MNSSETPPAESVITAGINWGSAFLNRFEFKVRKAGRLVHPESGEEFEINPSVQERSFKRSFGEVVQFRLGSGILNRARLNLTAVNLAVASPTATDGDSRSAEELLRDIPGPSGLDLPDGSFHCIGVFSHAGWPEERRAYSEIRGDALCYLVQKEEGTLWSVFGPEGSLKHLFDPEISEEKRIRARDALHSDSRLILAGNPVAADAFVRENHLDSTTVLLAVQASDGLFQILEHKGKSYIQRCFR